MSYVLLKNLNDYAFREGQTPERSVQQAKLLCANAGIELGAHCYECLHPVDINKSIISYRSSFRTSVKSAS